MLPSPDTGPAVVHEDIGTLVARARNLAQSGKRRLLGVVGAPGAGKSTLCAALHSQLQDSSALVSMDGFHLANEELIRLGRRERKGAPDTFDVGGYVALLDRLRAQSAETGAVYAPRFDRDLETSIGSAVRVDPATPLVITEGNYLLLADGPWGWWGQVAARLDEIWYLDVAAAVRTERLIRRRQASGEDAGTAARWVHTVDGANAEIVESTKGKADLIVSLIV